MTVRLSQASFASGEITPLLHARTDLTRYATALAQLKNMIVLPEGGVTRRPGFGVMSAATENRKLIPFVYNTTDSAMLEFGWRWLRVWAQGRVQAQMWAPYISYEDDLRWAQSGNVMILASGNHPLYMLTRNSLTDWTLEPFDFEGGPWVPGDDVKEGSSVKITDYLGDDVWVLTSSEEGTFTTDMIGSLVKLEYSVSLAGVSVESEKDKWRSTDALEVRSNFNVTTTGSGWGGKLRIERKTGWNGQWQMLREFTRTDSSTEGQVDFTVAETEENVFYRARIYQTSGGTITVNATSEGFVKSFVFKIRGVDYREGKTANVIWQKDEDEHFDLWEILGQNSLGWWLNAWGRAGSYPRAVAFYQDRLVLAGSKLQPQTIWMSRVGDYKDFSTSDPVADDDAITITLTARTADGIHSLVATDDLLVFTNAGEWKISGAGDAGAVSPTAVVAHQQSNIGSKAIQPILTNGRVIFIQTHGQKVYALGYDLNTDGYTGSEISILSSHIFKGKEITDFAWQQVPDGLLWFSLSDGTAATCTYNPEHETVGWARQELANGNFLRFACIPGDRQTELWATGWMNGQYQVMRAARRADEAVFSDNGTAYESAMQTLRVTLDGQNGSAFPAKKLLSRLTVSALRSQEAWAAPADWGTRSSNWDRRRKITWDYADALTDAEIQLDSGFANDASIQIRTSGGPLTVAAIIPMVTFGG